ncbi:MAG TPA: NAD-dependent epimerase/dehydratase family protein [Candidatus Bathyarchaeia archaeon]|nr:NAD-dependent epimerase/dehydratase family protein [Candidatus Bathyarchaeia archaeon]
MIEAYERQDPLFRQTLFGADVMLEACRKFGVKFEQISTDEVYGSGSRMKGPSQKKIDLIRQVDTQPAKQLRIS